MTSLKMFAALNGDAFLIREEAPNGAAILIDGGYPSTFQNSIRPVLLEMQSAGQHLDLVIATHIDADHISGLLELFTVNGKAQSPNVIQIDQVWHNSLRALSPRLSDGILSNQDRELLSEISDIGFLISCGDSTLEQEISGRQGSSLAALLLEGNYHWNDGNGRQSINSSAPQTFEPAPGVRIHVLGPSSDRLEMLRHQWLKELRRFGFAGKISESQTFDDAFEFLCARDSAISTNSPVEIAHTSIVESTLTESYDADDSINNGSSLAIIIETPSSRMLFLGDAWAEDMVREIRALPNEKFPILFDAIKISHHGSVRNTSPELLDLIDSQVFLISSNGARHNHPDLPVLKAIVDRPSSHVRHMHFNYATAASAQLRSYRPSSGAKFEVHENSTDSINIERNTND